MSHEFAPVDLDNYITGHWGEDQFRDDDEEEEDIVTPEEIEQQDICDRRD